MTHCPCFHGSRWKLLSVTALPLCSPHLLLLLRGPLLCFETLEGKDISSCRWRPSLQFVLSLGRIFCHSSLHLCLFLHRWQVGCPHFPSADFPPIYQEIEATESQSTVSSCLNSRVGKRNTYSVLAPGSDLLWTGSSKEWIVLSAGVPVLLPMMPGLVL